jgi:dTDP-4-amino-4,6-dideoxygalactose transaminase
MTNIKVPFNDLSRIHKPIENKVIKNIRSIVNKNSFILGEYVEEFEKNFSNFTNSKYSISCGNGTDAIELVLRALDIKNGDEVILQANTFIATALAVSRTGATPVFIDNGKDYLLDSDNISKAISKKTKAIISVNLYGQMGDNRLLHKIAKKNNLYFIEDSAQAHGATQNGKSPGNYSIASTYSFYPGKNLGAWGDGGCITTNNKQLAEKLIYLRNWGSKKKYFHNTIGFNSRLDPIQAAVLNVKLNFLQEWNINRNEIANFYTENLSNKYELPKVNLGNFHVWHLYVVRTKKRNQLIEEGKKHNIEFGIHYPRPVHKQKAYSDLRVKKLLNSEKQASELVSLPMFPKMKKNEIQKVVSFLNNF